MARLRLVPIALVVSMLWVVAGASAAPPSVPASLPYQGLLLDGLGAPRTGSLDLTLRVWDALVGGTLVYKQSFPSVALADGVFTVQLGPSGEGSDAPSNPLTTDLATALAGDAGATAPVRFLEVTVNAEGALARTQILSSAYALRASSAATADSATTATTATDVVNVGGVGASFVSQLFEHYAFDGANPPNDDPSEGLGDVDGDGLANFIDSDNDADTIADITEIGAGSNINLVTPTLAAASPTNAFFTTTVNVTVTGTNFQPPLSVAFGSQTPTPTNVTPTSFQVTVGPQAPGAASIQVTNANGETDTAANLFTWLQSLAHTVVLNPGTNAYQSSLDVRPGTSFVVFSGQKQYGVGDINAGLTVWSLTSRGAGGQIATAFAPGSGRLEGVRCLPSGTNCNVELLSDTDNDGNLQDETAVPIETLVGSNTLLNAASLGFEPSGRRVVGYQRFDAAGAAPMVAHDHNGDGDFSDANELVSAGGSTATSAIPNALAVDAAGRAAFVRGGTSVAASWDRNDDGDFADAGELFDISTSSPNCIGATFDSASRLAVVFGVSGALVLVRDLNADGDFLDAGEAPTLAASGGNACDVGWRAGQPFTVAYASGGGFTVLADENDDGDFADAGETSNVPATSTTGMRLRGNGTTATILGYQGFLALVPTN